MTNDARDRIANIGAGMVPTYHATESVDEARAVVESCWPATHELRRLLNERGVRWKGYGYENHTWWGEWHAESRASVNGLFVKVEALLTPAQAIEASLGDGEYQRKMDELLCRLTNGKFSKTRTYNLDFMESVVREEFETDAAALEAGTCHAIISDNLTESEGMGDAWADCSECGHLLFVLTDPNSEPPNYCPNCGCRVREVE